MMRSWMVSNVVKHNASVGWSCRTGTKMESQKHKYRIENNNNESTTMAHYVWNTFLSYLRDKKTKLFWRNILVPLSRTDMDWSLCHGTQGSPLKVTRQTGRRKQHPQASCPNIQCTNIQRILYVWQQHDSMISSTFVKISRFLAFFIDSKDPINVDNVSYWHRSSICSKNLSEIHRHAREHISAEDKKCSVYKLKTSHSYVQAEGTSSLYTRLPGIQIIRMCRGTLNQKEIQLSKSALSSRNGVLQIAVPPRQYKKKFR